MKHLSKLIETYLMPLSQKLSSNKYLVALRDGLMLSMPLLIVGSLAIVIGDFPIPAFHEFMTSIVGDVWNTVLGYGKSSNYGTGCTVCGGWSVP